jgi:hypothetical protein
MEKSLETEPIDLVYCWCDGNDQAFKARKNKYLEEAHLPKDSDDVGDLRFWDNNELKYSLRSVEKNVPWVNHIYIVTDRQVPKWLNLANPKITLVDHAQILPAELIPTFASTVIERHIHKIQGLTEKFLYANDDLFFDKPLTKKFFFTGNRPKVYVTYYERFTSVEDEQDFQKKFAEVATWMKTNLNVWKLLFKQYGRHEFYVSPHVVDGYTKTLFQEVVNRYQEAFDLADKERFRSAACITRSIFGLDMAYSGQADLEIVKKPGFWEKHIHHDPHHELKCFCGSENAKTRKEILRFEPDIFCVNADIKCNLQDKKDMQLFYEKLFPEPSSFEKA